MMAPPRGMPGGYGQQPGIMLLREGTAPRPGPVPLAQPRAEPRPPPRALRLVAILVALALQVALQVAQQVALEVEVARTGRGQGGREALRARGGRRRRA